MSLLLLAFLSLFSIFIQPISSLCFAPGIVQTSNNGEYNFWLHACADYSKYTLVGNYTMQSVNPSPHDSWEVQFGEQVCGTTDLDFYRSQTIFYDNIGTVVQNSWSRSPSYVAFDGRTRLRCRNLISDCVIYVSNLCMELVDKETGHVVDGLGKLMMQGEEAAKFLPDSDLGNKENQ